MSEKENKQNRLSESEKAQIKEAVLKQAEINTRLLPEELAIHLYQAFVAINNNGEVERKNIKREKLSF